jgi:hypothetical protein
MINETLVYAGVGIVILLGIIHFFYTNFYTKKTKISKMHRISKNRIQISRNSN